MSSTGIKHSPQWTTPRPATADEKTTSLRNSLIGVYAVVQASFVAYVIGVHIAAQGRMTGEGFNDLGVALGRELYLSQVYDYWIFTALTLALVFVGAYAVAKRRWTS